MVTFALFSLFFSIQSKDERDSAFSLGTFSDKTFAITTAVSFLLLLLSTVNTGHLPDRDGHHHARRPAMADLHRRGTVDRRGRRDPQSRTTAARCNVTPPVYAESGGRGKSCTWQSPGEDLVR